MSYGELTLPPVYSGVNAKNGRFMKGHVPHNKGKRWAEYMGKRAMKRASKGWENVVIHRPKKRSDVAGRCRKPVVAVTDDGRWCVFPHSGYAAQWVGGNRSNVGRCCRENQARYECRHNWRPGQTKGASLVNTDHKYRGIRFYFESDNAWITKIRKT